MTQFNSSTMVESDRRVTDRYPLHDGFLFLRPVVQGTRTQYYALAFWTDDDTPDFETRAARCEDGTAQEFLIQ